MAFRKRTAGIVVGILVLIAVAVAVRPSLAYPLLPRGHGQTFTYEQEDITVRIEYPEFGRPNVDAATSAFREDLVTTLKEQVNGHEHEAGTRATLSVSYRVIWRTLRYASVVFDVSVSSGELADTFHYVHAATYDLRGDRQIPLSDFGSGAPVIARSEVQERLRGTEGVDVQLVGRASLNEFVLHGDEIVFFLNPGQVAAPEKGVVEVAVPRESFSN